MFTMPSPPISKRAFMKSSEPKRQHNQFYGTITFKIDKSIFECSQERQYGRPSPYLYYSWIMSFRKESDDPSL